MALFRDPLTDKLAAFLLGVGIPVRARPGTDASLLPGIDVRGGVVLVDEAGLEHPGDLLHEGGHVAVCDPATRALPALVSDGGDEMTAIAWSYAAALHLAIDPAVVFHDEGYKGNARSILESFRAGRYFGVPLLHLYGMAIEPRQAKPGERPYPHMLRWLR